MKLPITKLRDPGIDLEQITDPAIRSCITLLFNLVEEVSLDNDRLRAENQALRDENARLKGEQGKPDIRGHNRRDISSEQERKTDRKPPKNTPTEQAPWLSRRAPASVGTVCHRWVGAVLGVQHTL